MFERGFERLRLAYEPLLTRFVYHRGIFAPVFLLVALSAFLLVPWLGQDFFAAIDSGQLLLHVRAKAGTGIEETARLCDLVEASIRREIPNAEVENMLADLQRKHDDRLMVVPVLDLTDTAAIRAVLASAFRQLGWIDASACPKWQRAAQAFPESR